jgi:bzd-type benzoyl-CoA reductase N subunit
MENRIIGLTCSYIPEEILVAAKAVPFRIHGSVRPPELSTSYLPANFCPYVLSCLDCGVKKEYDFLDGLIIADSCNAMRRLYDAWRYFVKTKFVYMLDLPKSKDKAAEMYFKNALSKLINALENKYGISIHDKDLRDAIVICNETRRLLNELTNIRQNHDINVPSEEIYKIFQESKTLPKNEFNMKLSKVLTSLKNTAKKARGHDSKIRLLITGSFHNPAEIINYVEKLGAKVVFEDICTSGRYPLEEINTDKPLDSIAHFYINKPQCARMVGCDDRVDYISKLINQYKIDGIIYYALKFCDTHLLDLPFLKRSLDKKNVPILFLEGDSLLPSSGQMKTRIKAFLEMF